MKEKAYDTTGGVSGDGPEKGLGLVAFGKDFVCFVMIKSHFAEGLVLTTCNVSRNSNMYSHRCTRTGFVWLKE